MSIPRLFFASNIVRDTRLIVIGGEYSGIGVEPQNWTRTGEAYDPATDTGTASRRTLEQQFGDVPTILLDGDRILAGSLTTEYLGLSLSDRYLGRNPIQRSTMTDRMRRRGLSCPADTSSPMTCSSHFHPQRAILRRFSIRSRTSGCRRLRRTARPLGSSPNCPPQPWSRVGWRPPSEATG